MGFGAHVLGVGELTRELTESIDRLDGEAVWVVGTNVEYAAYVEFGTSRMKAQPYLLPAARRVARTPSRHVNDYASLDGFIKQVALAIEREAKDNAPVDTGNLQGSITAERVR